MKHVATVVLAAALCAGIALPVQAADRLTDKQVKATVENIERGFGTWKDALEKRNLDDAVIRNASGTIEVKKFLKDFKDELDLVKDRLKPEYAANPEMTVLLRRASDVQRRAQQPGQNPLAEWKELAAQFTTLAGAYGTSFPLPSTDAAAMRLADMEVAGHIEGIEQRSKVVASDAEKALKQAKAPEADRAKTKQAFTALEASAKQTRSMLNADTVTGAQVEALLKSARTAGELVKGLALTSPGKTAWETLDGHAARVAKAFGLTW